MYCNRCGSELSASDRFCQNCGEPVAARQAAELVGAMKGVQELASSTAAEMGEPVSETPSLTEDFAVPRERYNLILALVLLWGFVLNVVFCIFFTPYAARLSFSLLLILYAALAIPGMLINTHSSRPIWSFVGYNMVVLPLGVVLSVLTAELGSDVVRETFQITAAVTAGMLLLSSWKPQFFLRMGPCLLGALALTLVAELLMFLFSGSFELTNVIIALLFCGYIGYDWARAQQRPSTVDNAVDSACALYMDIINLMLRLLSSRRRDD